MAADNSAYDYFLHDNPHKPADAYDEPVYMPRMPAEEPEIIRAPKITMKKTTPKRGSASKVFLIALSAFSLAFIVLSSKVETNKMYRQISSANQNLESMQSENVRLQSELESKMTLKNVEEYAVKVLGLQKLNNSQIKYVETQTDDVVEIPEEEKNIFVKVKDKFDKLVEYIFG